MNRTESLTDATARFLLELRTVDVVGNRVLWRERGIYPTEALLEVADLIKRLDSQRKAIAKLHSPFSIYDECGHEHRNAGGDVFDVEEIGLTCKRLYDVCHECCAPEDGQTETCCGDHEHGLDKPICSTREILDNG